MDHSNKMKLLLLQTVFKEIIILIIMLMLNLIIKMQIMDKHNNKRLLFFLKLKRQNLVDNKQQSQLDITF